MKLTPLKCVCSIQVTCWQKEDEQKMEVEMAYEGDATLASYLLLTAQEKLEEELTSLDQLSEHNCAESPQKKARSHNKKPNQNQCHDSVVEKTLFRKKSAQPP